MVKRKKGNKPGVRTARSASPKKGKSRSYAVSQKRRDITLNDRLVLYLNGALSMENAATERLEARIRQTKLVDSKVQLQHHLE
ncbi:MAG TPA: hypothetical protein VE378_03455, partial [Nitrososphaeraceae archaeon]|nr:hypothetical protein [Nitrososphaeraceae archaeon]